ncbi:acyl-CoA synthetase FdrA [Candidatus Sumerlaeota bacterium]|nr:acyl-CoA synthetase FdrA [Candidatus Sumerlaeota bacterium]
MRISRDVKALDGVTDAVVAMATPHNRELLAQSGYESEALAKAGPNDLVIAVRTQGVDAEEVERAVDRLLRADRAESGAAERPQSLTAALREAPEANMALISLPGEFAAREARSALRRGLHVMLFSDNVSVEDEIALKREATARGLLMMGPDCGTAIIGGKPLAFANVVRRGPIGVVGASGTGIQEITCCIHRLGGGISQAIGTGGRDLSDAVGGAMTLLGIEALAGDPQTEVIVVVSKPPSPRVADRVIEALQATGKSAVIHFVGAEAGAPLKGDVALTDSLAGAAEEACRRVGLAVPDEVAIPGEILQGLAKRLAPEATLRGLFCGGTTGQEAVVLLERAGVEVKSNLHRSGPRRIDGIERESGHVVLDLGADEFTAGRPHPMIELALRSERLAIEVEDESVGLLLFDCVLGYGSHGDPAGILAESVRAIGRDIVAIVSITGTPEDPQGFDGQRRKLEDAGIVVMPDNRRAVALAAALLGRGV